MHYGLCGQLLSPGGGMVVVPLWRFPRAQDVSCIGRSVSVAYDNRIRCLNHLPGQKCLSFPFLLDQTCPTTGNKESMSITPTSCLHMAPGRLPECDVEWCRINTPVRKGEIQAFSYYESMEMYVQLSIRVKHLISVVPLALNCRMS